MAALIESTIDQDDPLASSAGYKAERVNMEDADTVESRVAGIIQDDSELMQRAKTQAKQGAAKTGLLNTSMAVKAGQTGVMDAATPIATSDAQTSAAMKLANQAAGNDAGRFNAGELNKGRTAVHAGNQQMEAIRGQGEVDLANIGAKGDVDLANIAANVAGDSRLQAERGEIDKQLLTAEGEVKLGLLNRQGEIDEELANLAVEHDSRLQTEKGEIDKQLIDADGQVKIDLQARQAEITKELEAIRNEYIRGLNRQKAAIDLKLLDASAEDALELQRQRGIIDTKLANISAGATISAASIGARSRIEAANIGAQSAIDQIKTSGYINSLLSKQDSKEAERLATINGDYDTLISSDRNAAALASGHNANITNILNNPELSSDQKQEYVAAENTIYASSLEVISINSGTDYSSVLNF